MWLLAILRKYKLPVDFLVGRVRRVHVREDDEGVRAIGKQLDVFKISERIKNFEKFLV